LDRVYKHHFEKQISEKYPTSNKFETAAAPQKNSSELWFHFVCVRKCVIELVFFFFFFSLLPSFDSGKGPVRALKLQKGD
jgi:hypothetical protein